MLENLKEKIYLYTQDYLYQINLFTCINNNTSLILKINIFRSLVKFVKVVLDLTLLGREFQFLAAK